MASPQLNMTASPETIEQIGGLLRFLAAVCNHAHDRDHEAGATGSGSTGNSKSCSGWRHAALGEALLACLFGGEREDERQAFSRESKAEPMVTSSLAMVGFFSGQLG